MRELLPSTDGLLQKVWIFKSAWKRLKKAAAKGG
jgi:hypothetical protein